MTVLDRDISRRPTFSPLPSISDGRKARRQAELTSNVSTFDANYPDNTPPVVSLLDQSLPSAKQRIENGYNNSNHIRHATPVRILTGWKKEMDEEVAPQASLRPRVHSSEDEKEHQPSLATPSRTDGTACLGPRIDFDHSSSKLHRIRSKKERLYLCLVHRVRTPRLCDEKKRGIDW